MINKIHTLRALRKLWIKKHPEKFSKIEVEWSKQKLQIRNPNYGLPGELEILEKDPQDISIPNKFKYLLDLHEK